MCTLTESRRVEEQLQQICKDATYVKASMDKQIIQDFEQIAKVYQIGGPPPRGQLQPPTSSPPPSLQPASQPASQPALSLTNLCVSAVCLSAAVCRIPVVTESKH